MKELASLLPILGIFLVFWLLVIRPASRRQKQLQAVQRSLSLGDEVVTNAGIFGTIVTLGDERVGLQVAEGVVIEVARPAIAGVASPHESATSDTDGTTDGAPDRPTDGANDGPTGERE